MFKCLIEEITLMSNQIPMSKYPMSKDVFIGFFIEQITSKNQISKINPSVILRIDLALRLRSVSFGEVS